MKKLQFQSILAAHMVFSVAGHEKMPMTAAPDNAACGERCKKHFYSSWVGKALDLLLLPQKITLLV
jgi:hypothetical protein